MQYKTFTTHINSRWKDKYGIVRMNALKYKNTCKVSYLRMYLGLYVDVLMYRFATSKGLESSFVVCLGKRERERERERERQNELEEKASK